MGGFRLFKALAVNGSLPGRPWIIWRPGADQGLGRIRAARWVVLRSYRTDLYLWSDVAQTRLER